MHKRKNKLIGSFKKLKIAAQANFLVLYRLDKKLKRYKWASALINSKLDQDFFKMLKNIYIPINPKNLIFKNNFTENELFLPFSDLNFQNLYEIETLGKYPRSNVMVALPLVFNHEVSGIIILSSNQSIQDIIKQNTIQSQIVAIAQELHNINLQFDKAKIQKSPTRLKKSPTLNSSIFYLEIMPPSNEYKDSIQIIYEKLFKLIHSIIQESIFGSSSKLLCGNDNSILVFNNKLQYELPVVIKSIQKITKLLNKSLVPYNNPRIEIKYGFMVDRFLVIRNKNSFALIGSKLRVLKKITHLTLPGKIQTNENTAKIINNYQETIYRGKINLTNSKTIKLFLFN